MPSKKLQSACLVANASYVHCLTYSMIFSQFPAESMSNYKSVSIEFLGGEAWRSWQSSILIRHHFINKSKYQC